MNDCGLKSRIFVEVDDLRIIGSNKCLVPLSKNELFQSRYQILSASSIKHLLSAPESSSDHIFVLATSTINPLLIINIS
jgi:hypothetical protein